MSGAVYRITHRTRYAYERPVSASYGQLHLLPRDLPGQRCRSASVTVDPPPARYRERLDFFGNRTAYFAVQEAHRELTVTAASVVEVEDRSAALSLFAERSWESVRDAVRAREDGVDADVIQYVLDSPLVAARRLYRNYAAASFPPGGGALAGITSLCSRIHAEWAYAPGTTSVSTPLGEVFARRRGVCQDLAHVGIACLRSLGLPARYVSGYLETDPPPGVSRLQGVDGSHAWLSVFVPGAGWIELDPTNDRFAGSRHVITAIGRDYGDVPPMNGVIYTEARESTLEVAVDVVAVG